MSFSSISSIYKNSFLFCFFLSWFISSSNHFRLFFTSFIISLWYLFLFAFAFLCVESVKKFHLLPIHILLLVLLFLQIFLRIYYFLRIFLYNFDWMLNNVVYLLLTEFLKTIYILNLLLFFHMFFSLILIRLLLEWILI